MEKKTGYITLTEISNKKFGTLLKIILTFTDTKETRTLLRYGETLLTSILFLVKYVWYLDIVPYNLWYLVKFYITYSK